MNSNLRPRLSTIEKHPNYRVVQVSNRAGEVGMLLPHANLVVPDRQSIRNLKEIIQLYEKLPEAAKFYKSTTSS